MGDQPLRGDVVLVESEMVGADVERAHGLTWREPLELRYAHFDHEASARLRCAATFWKHATCSSCEVRLLIVLKTR